jgi:two-component system, LytTR family, response regulator
VLLDIQMPELDGFEVIRELSGPKVPLIIFVTGYNKYAVQAFKVSAVHYLLKPILEEELKEALGRARKKLLEELVFPSMEAMEQIHRLTGALDARISYMKRVLGQRKSQSLVLQVPEIQVFECTDEQVYAVINEQERWMLNHTMKYLEAHLNPNRFVRVHRQAIVNVSYVVEIDQAPSGDGSAKLECGLTVDVSRRNVPLLRDKLAS